MLSARTYIHERIEPTANTVADWVPLREWTSLSWEDLKVKDEQKKKDNKLHIEVRRKDLFR